MGNYTTAAKNSDPRLTRAEILVISKSMVYHTSPTDANSFAQTDVAIITQSHFDWIVNFEAKKLRSTLTIEFRDL